MGWGSEVPLGESVACLDHECFLAGEICLDFGDGWKDILLQAEGVLPDPYLGGWIVGALQFNDQTSKAILDSLKAVKFADCILGGLVEGEAGHLVRFG